MTVRETKPGVKHDPGRPQFVGDLVTVFIIVGLLGLVYLLPADTSLSQVRSSGRLVACVPTSFPPLVTRESEAPGFDVELLRAIAERIGVELSLNTNTAIGRDFNPRSWRVNRAQCQVLAGGVVLSRSVRSFLETVPTPLSTGWAVVSPERIETLDGQEVGFFAGITGLDRIGLGRYLRETDAGVQILQSREELEAGLASGEFTAGISETLIARQIAAETDWRVQWMPASIERYHLGFGLWRGDLTLLRAFQSALAELERESFVEGLIAKYDIAPVDGVLGEL